MANYTDQECIICNKKFTDGDDIVVCPECGTPYHRECYSQEGKCVNTVLHEKKKSWSDQKAEEPIKCSLCNAENPPGSFICERCGSSLLKGMEEPQGQSDNKSTGQNGGFSGFTGFSFDPNDRYCGLDPHEKITDNVNVEEAADFIGTNVPYYLMLFKRMRDTGKNMTINAVCILFPQFYFAHRKMMIEALAVIILSSILSIPSMLYAFSAVDAPLRFISNDVMETNAFLFITRISNYLSLAINLLTCLFANRLYMGRMKRKIGQIKAHESDLANVKNSITLAGGTSTIYLLVALAAQFIASAIITFTFLKI